ncbi:Uncharacterized protein APZ42_004434, partial [Daphnia magna]
STAQDEDTMQQQQLVDNDPSTTSQSQLTDVESLIAQWVTDPECVKEILEDHRNFPPQHKRRDPKENPATQKKLNYFLKVLELKIVKESKLANCSIPQSLKNIPLALSYETFITLYWPGTMSCCKSFTR